MNTPLNRRELLSKGIGFFIAAPVSIAAVTAFAKEAAKTAAKPSASPSAAKLKLVDADKDPVAKALKYNPDAKKVDPKIRVAKMGVAGDQQFCHNCTLYTVPGTAEDGSQAGKCTMIAGGAVRADGWCTSWIKKA